MFRAKVYIQSVRETGYMNVEGAVTKEVTMLPVGATEIPEDLKFNTATPSGEIKLSINNKAVWPDIVVGRYFYVDFNEVPKV